MYCQLGQVGCKAERSGGVGKKVSKHEAGNTRIERKTRKFKSTMEDKLKLQSRANKRYHDLIFEEMKELEEKKSEEALQMVQKKHSLWRYQNEREEAGRLQSSGNSRRVKKGLDLQHPTSSESCRSSTVDHDEEMTLESLRKRQEVQEVMKETEWKKARAREKEA